MAGYTRQSTFADGDTITAALFNNEYNQLLNAFSNTGGHKHDGTAAEGPVIGLIGDAGVTTPLNKVLIDSTNDHIEFWIEVSSSAVQQLYIADGAIVPVTDNDIDLGTSSLQFKDLYINGTANIDSLVLATGSTVTAVLDEDDLSSDSATSLVTQQSVKAYIDAQVTAQDLDFLGDSGGALSIDLDSESLTIAGGTGLDTVGSSNTITINIDATVATLTGTQTLTNKTIDVDNNTVSNIEVDNFKASAIVLESEGIGSNDNDTSLPTSAAVKDYVDTQITAEDLDITTDSGTIAIDLDSETLTVSGGTGLDSSATGNAVTLAIDSTVTTLTGTQTLTNKTLTTPVISSISNTGTLTLPTSTDTLVGRATTDTLTNKTLTSPVINTGVSGTAFLDDDTFGTATASTLASSESIKAYVDAQVATADSLAEVLANGNTTGGSNILFADNDKVAFGAGSDLQIYHDGNNSYISDTGTGNLNILANEFAVYEGNGTDLMIGATPNGAVTLSHNAQTKLATTSTGIDVTGTVTADGLTISSATANVADLRRANNAGAGQVLLGNSDGHVRLSGTNGSFDVFNSGNTAQRFGIANNGDISFYEDTGSTQALFWDASAESLGIGTTSPSEKLHVLTTGNTIGKFETTTTSDLAIELKNSQGSMFFGLGGGEEFAVGTTSDLNGAGNLFTIKQDGNVGIGTTSPSEALHVYHATANVNAIIESGDANAYLAFKDNSTSSSASVFLGASANDMTFFAGGTTERMRIDSSGNVGIGVTNPSSYWGQADNLVVGGTGNDGITIKSSTSGNGRLIFTDTESSTAGQNDGGQIQYNHASDYMTLRTNGAERMRIDSSGNLLVGTTDSNVTNNSGDATQAGINLGVAGIKGYIAAARYQGAPLALNRLDNDGDIAVFTQDGATVGSIGVNSSTKLYIGAGDSAVRFDPDNNAIRPHNASTNGSTDAVLDLGVSNNRFKDLYLSGTANIDKALIGTSSAGATDAKLTLENGFSDCSIYIGAGGDYNYIRSIRNANNDHDLAIGKNYGGGSDAEHLRITNEGNVGIGADNPDGNLHVSSGSAGTVTASTDANELVLEATANVGMTLLTGNSSIARIRFGDADSNARGNIFYNHANDSLGIQTAASTAMTIDSSGNVGIGTTSPGTQLTLNKNDNNFLQIRSSDTGNAGIYFGRQNDSVRGAIVYDNSNESIQFLNNNYNEKMRIDSSGNLLVGKTSTSFSTDGVEIKNDQIWSTNTSSDCISLNRKTTDGAIATFYKDGSAVGSISVTSSATTYNTSSDARLKDVTGEARGLEVINELNPVAYNWKADGKADEGLIAQEVQEIVPNAVSGSEEEMYQMDYSKLVVHLVKAIKEQQTQIEALQSEINLLKGE
jgi:hypothetical protein